MDRCFEIQGGIREMRARDGLAAGHGGELGQGALEAAERVADVEGEAEGLGEQELRGDDGVLGHGEFLGEGGEHEGVVFGFGGEIQTARHDVARVVDHRRVREVEAAQVLYRSGLLFWFIIIIITILNHSCSLMDLLFSQIHPVAPLAKGGTHPTTINGENAHSPALASATGDYTNLPDA